MEMPTDVTKSEEKSSYVNVETSPCGRCDRGQSAKASCSECQMSFCLACLEIHRRHFSGHRVQSIFPHCQATEDCSLLSDIMSHLKIVEALRDRLEGEKQEVERQRHLVDSEINALFTSGLEQLARARDECTASLATAAASANDKLQAELLTVSKTHLRLSGLESAVSSVDDAPLGDLHSPTSLGDLHSSLLSENEMLHFRQRMNAFGRSVYFAFSPGKVSPPDLVAFFRGYMGTVMLAEEVSTLPSSLPSEKEGESDDVSKKETQHTSPSVKRESVDTQDMPPHLAYLEAKWTSQFSSLASLVQDLKNRNDLIDQREVTLQEEQCHLREDVRALREENTVFQQEITLMRFENTHLQEDIADLKKETSEPSGNDPVIIDEKGILAIDLNEMLKENSSLQQELTNLRADIEVLKSMGEILRGEHIKMHQNTISLQTKQNNLTTEVTELWDEMRDLCQGLKSMQGDNSTLRCVFIQVQADLTKLKNDFIDLKGNNTVLQQELQAIHEDKSKVNEKMMSSQVEREEIRKDVTHLQDDVSRLRYDLTENEDHNKELRQDLTSTEDRMKQLGTDLSCKQDVISEMLQKLSTLEEAVAKLLHEICIVQNSLVSQSMIINALETGSRTAGCLVAFHAILQHCHVTTTKKRVLIMDVIITNIGGGYNIQTGIFTTAVGGTYIFLVTTGPWVEEKISRLVMVVDSINVAFLLAKGETSCSAHATVKVVAGRKVWLETFDGDDCTFRHNWMTSFSGILVQPELRN